MALPPGNIAQCPSRVPAGEAQIAFRDNAHVDYYSAGQRKRSQRTRKFGGHSETSARRRRSYRLRATTSAADGLEQAAREMRSAVEALEALCSAIDREAREISSSSSSSSSESESENEELGRANNTGGKSGRRLKRLETGGRGLEAAGRGALESEKGGSSSESSDESDSETGGSARGGKNSIVVLGGVPVDVPEVSTAPQEDLGAGEGVAVGIAVGKVVVCQGKSCVKQGGLAVMNAAEECGGPSGVEVRPCKCLGMCGKGPAVMAKAPGVRPVKYGGVAPNEIERLMDNHFPKHVPSSESVPSLIGQT